MKTALSNPWTFITLCLALPVATFSIIKWYNIFYEPPPTYGNVQHASFEKFVNQNNDHINNIEPGKVTVVNFFFTSCPVVCVKMMKGMKRVHDRFNANSNVKFISISVDPQTDTPERLKWYITKMHINDNRWNMLTGTKPNTYALARNQFQLVAAEANADNDFIHSDKLVLIDAKRNIRGYYNGLSDSEIEKLIDDINKLKP